MWDWAIWVALTLAGVTGTVALALVAVRARQAWGDLERMRRDVVGRLDALAATGEATADAVAAAGGTTEVRESLGRLRRSLARLAVLRAALDEALDTFGRVAAMVPRK